MIGTETLIGGNNTLENRKWFLDTIGTQYKVSASHSECKNEYEKKDMIILRVSSNVLVSDLLWDRFWDGAIRDRPNKRFYRYLF